jgi:aspartyl-tRNA(Asn)/glutamyl-tRNA(Gln) amidotransferase subunit C
MRITKEQIAHVAHLARLELTAAEVERFAAQIGEILDYVDQLKQVETSGVAPTAHATAAANAFREDEERPHLPREAALANAPEKDAEHFVVPKVVG